MKCRHRETRELGLVSLEIFAVWVWQGQREGCVIIVSRGSCKKVTTNSPLSHSSAGQESEIKVWAGLFSSGGFEEETITCFSPGFWWFPGHSLSFGSAPPFSTSLFSWPSSLCLCVSFSPYRSISHWALVCDYTYEDLFQARSFSKTLSGHEFGTDTIQSLQGLEAYAKKW